MEKYINEHGMECYKNVTMETPFDITLFRVFPDFTEDDDNTQVVLHTNIGVLTVIDRIDGFGWRNIETGFRDKDGKLWLTPEGFDVRESGAKNMKDAIEWVKKNANTCVG